MNGAVILVVENDDALRSAIRRLLELAGYEVLAAQDAAEAQRLGRPRLGQLDLVLSDIVLPGMSGVDLVKGLRSERPGLQVIFMSASTAELAGLPAGDNWLAKPFDDVQLLRRVRAALRFNRI